MAAEQVRTSWASLRNVWREQPGNDIWLRLRGHGGSLEQFNDAVNAAQRTFEQSKDEPSLFPEAPTSTPGGWVVRLSEPDDFDEVQVWVEAFTAELTQRGFAGQLGWAPTVFYPDWLREGRVPWVTAFIAYTVDLPAMIADPGRNSSWHVPAEATARISAFAAEWAVLADAQPVLHLDRYAIAGQFDDVATELTRCLLNKSPAGIDYRHKSDRRANVVHLSYGGEATYQQLDEPADWRARLDRLRSAITALPTDTTQAYIRPTIVPALSHDCIDNPQKLPGIDESHVRYNKHLLDRYLPDAHGIQLVTSAHLANAHDLSAWQITDLGHDRHLVQARDLELWYAKPLPDPTVVERARADFAGALLTEQVMADNPMPWPYGRTV